MIASKDAQNMFTKNDLSFKQGTTTHIMKLNANLITDCPIYLWIQKSHQQIS